ncbi:nuclear transport factor 2 family protein [Paractinoplanes lichenicola]|uniref:nuclear transport factor 2 family protein n=1 Tax=Paractinoplanes lichenicola TaxID=2802976 RepID=UPI0034DAF176
MRERGMSMEQRLRTIEDRLAIYDLLVAFPLSDTGDRAAVEAVYSESFVFDRAGLGEVRGWDALWLRSREAAPVGRGFRHQLSISARRNGRENQPQRLTMGPSQCRSAAR